jgi:hypothetical protein
MPSLTMTPILLLAIVAGALVLYGLGRAALAGLAASGRAIERAARDEADLVAARRQGEIMAEHWSIDDVARRMSQSRDF